MKQDLRCEFIKHAELVSPGIIEFKCRSKKCGHGPGVVVLHKFNAMTGEMIGTDRFRDPERVNNGTSSEFNSVRDAAGSADSIH
jgi:hypothetical protein